MSDYEKETGADSSVVVDQLAASRHKQSIHSVDIQEASKKELPHKRSKTPVVSPVEESKDNHQSKMNLGSKDKMENEGALSPERHKFDVVKKLSSVQKRRDSSPDNAIKLASNVKKESNPGQPIPAQEIPDTQVAMKKTRAIKKKTDDEDSITEEVGELRTQEVAKTTSEWSDEEEASGLPRSESRASRVSRAVRQLFCCGVPLEPPSEHDISPRCEDHVA